MKNETDYLKQLAEIRNLMEKTSKFMSLSRFSGVVMGCYALAAAYIASHQLGKQGNAAMWNLIMLGIGTLLLSLATSFYFTLRRSKKMNLKIWGPGSKQLLSSMLVPLITGAVLIAALVIRESFTFIIPAMLLFYGLALTNASRFSHRELFLVGVIFLILGLAAVMFPGAGLVIWATGFGLVHIVYGAWMYFRHEMKS